MVSDWFSEVFSQKKSDIAKVVFFSYHNHSAVHYNLHCRLWTRTRTLCHFWMLSTSFFYFSIFVFLHFRILDNIRNFKREGVVLPYTILARTYLRTASTLQGLQTLDPFTDMYTYTGMCLAHPLDIVNTFCYHRQLGSRLVNHGL